MIKIINNGPDINTYLEVDGHVILPKDGEYLTESEQSLAELKARYPWLLNKSVEKPKDEVKEEPKKVEKKKK